jgi:predicted transcriptional regulator of viral defense system
MKLLSKNTFVVSKTTGLPPALASVSHGVLRPRDAAEVYAHPAPQLRRLVQRGRLKRLATGYYVVVPRAEDGRVWRPTLEAAGFGIAACDYGAEHVVLMGISAARMYGVVPRAVGVCVVAVPKQRPPVELFEGGGRVIFVRRRTMVLDAVRQRSDIGACLVTGVEQTVLDLAHRPELGGLPDEARAAVRALLPRCDRAQLDELAAAGRLRAAMGRALAWAEQHA